MSTLMEVKQKKTPIERKKRKNLFTFISELKQELSKVHWTTKAELISSTKAVVLSTFFFGIGIYLVDLAIKGALEVVKRAVLFVFG